MRIALVSQEFPPDTARGGIGTQTHLKAHGLAALGHEVHVISRSTTREPKDQWQGRVHVIRNPGTHSSLTAFTETAAWLAYSFEVAATLARLHAQAPFDLIDFPE